MNEPAPEQTEAPRIWPYIALFFVLGGLVLLAVLGNVARNEEKKATLSAMDSIQIRQMMLQEDLIRLAPSQASARTNSELKEALKSIEKKKLDLELARYKAGLELKLSDAASPVVSEDALEILRKDQDPTSKVLLEYLAEKDPSITKHLLDVKPTEISSRFLRFAILTHSKVGPSEPYTNQGAMFGFFGVIATGLGIFLIGALILLLGGITQGKRIFQGSFSRESIGEPAGSRFAIRTLIFLGCYSFLSVIGGGLSRSLPEGAGSVVTGLLLCGFAVFALSMRVDGVSDLGRVFGKIKFNRLVGYTFAGLALNALVLIPTALLTRVLTTFLPDASHPINEQLAQGMAPATVFSLLIVASICAPLAEETTFRGSLLRSLTQLFGRVRWALLAQGFFFAAMHPQGIAGWPALMGIGVVAGILAYKSGSLWPAILMHGIHNGMILCLNIALNSL